MVDAFNNYTQDIIGLDPTIYLTGPGDYDQFKSELMSLHWKICLASGLTVEKCSYIAS